MNKKSAKIIGILSAMALFSGCTASSPENNIRAVEDFSIEYGNRISENIADYLAEYSDETIRNEVIAGGIIEIKGKSLVEGTDYYPVGDYTVVISYLDKTEEIKVTVQDTVKPVWKTAPESINTAVNQKPDFTSLYSADDLSEVKITADDSQVDYSKAGNYKATISAADASGNTETKEVTVSVTEIIVSLNKTSLTLTAGETSSLKATVNSSDAKIIYSSSDKTVASIDSNGKITAKKAGTVTITASTGDAKAECKVAVKAKTAGGTNGQTSNNTNSSTNSNSNSNTGSVVSNPKLNKTSLDLNEEESYQLKVTGNNGSVKWYSSNTDIASVNSSGKVFGWKAGTATITGEVDGKQLTCKVTVKKVEVNASISSKALEHINAERAKVGLNPLKDDKRLHEGVKTRAIEAAEKYSHTRPDGSRWSTVISSLQCTLRGENIAKASSPKGAVDGWMGSEAHRMALLDGDYTHAAVGVYGNIYVCILIRY